MLTSDGCLARRERFWKHAGSSCDLAIFTRPEALRYFAAYDPSPFEFRANEAGAALVLTPERAILISDNVEKHAANASFVDEVLTPNWYDGKHPAIDRRELLAMSTAQAARLTPGKNLGVDTANVPTGIVERLAGHGGMWIDLGPSFHHLRRSKLPDEIACIERSLRVMEAATRALRQELRPGMTELDAFRIAQAAAIDAFGATIWIYGDFIAAPTIDRRGGAPSAKKIASGDLFLLDFSAVVQGYRGDFATTFAVGQTPTDAQLRLHAICLEAMTAGEALLRPGSIGRQIDAAVRSVIASHGLEAASPSHTGHGLGLGHPESPFLVRECDDVLVEGDVVTLEPSLFVAEIGGMRIEHNYLITFDGFRKLSNHSLDLSA
jgi:Xaa-Pro aminopeptidase